MNNNNKGITLLEVLLSMTILIIVLTAFLTLFPQVSLFNKKSDSALSSINLAKEKIVLLENIVRDDRSKADIDKVFIINNDDSLVINYVNKDFASYKLLNLTEDIKEETNTYVIKTNDNHLLATITINRTPEYKGIFHLYKVYVEIQDENLNEITSLYGYLSISK